MADVRVWAPQAKQMEISFEGGRIPMHQSAEWWSATLPDKSHGVDYTLFIDGEGPYPDPRSPWQPEGLQGPSRTVDHTHYLWTDAEWQPQPLSSAIFYELHIGTFTAFGTFDSAIDKLQYLVDLGVTHVEVMPIAEFSGNRGWGYDGSALYAPHHAYGGPEALKRFVDACHKHGLAVVLDVVYNHLGPVGNYLSRFGPYFTDRHATPWGPAINFDGPHSDEVRRYFIDNALMWIKDYHFDGLRLDAVHALFDTSAVHFLEELCENVKCLEHQLGRTVCLIAESDLNDPRIVRPMSLGGYGIDAQWNEDFHHALHAVLTKETARYYQDFGALADLAKAITSGLVYDGRYSRYRRRKHGRPAIGMHAHQFVGFLQNHDQIGNRALGERTSHLLSPDQLKIAAALVITGPFLPLLFQGEEWAVSTPFLYFTDHQDQRLGDIVYEGRKKEFADFKDVSGHIPHPQDEETYLQSKLHWDEQIEPFHHDILEWHRSLIALRKAWPDLTNPDLKQTTVTFDQQRQWLIMSRGKIMVICNLTTDEQNVPVPKFTEHKALLSSHRHITHLGDSFHMPGQSIIVISL